jgi:hypothetical protein
MYLNMHLMDKKMGMTWMRLDRHWQIPCVYPRSRSCYFQSYVPFHKAVVNVFRGSFRDFKVLLLVTAFFHYSVSEMKAFLPVEFSLHLFSFFWNKLQDFFLSRLQLHELTTLLSCLNISLNYCLCFCTQFCCL